MDNTAQSPSFGEIMDFNSTLWDKFRTGFMNGAFTRNEAELFLATKKTTATCPRIPQANKNVIFIERPPELEEIITYSRPYYVWETRDGKSKIYLDNDFSHWIENSMLCAISDDETARRSKR